MLYIPQGQDNRYAVFRTQQQEGKVSLDRGGR